MNVKKKLGMGIAAAIFGLALITGGTFAYFSDTAKADGTFASGTLDLSVNPTTIIEVDNLKPGDWMPRSFDLVNGGTLDIKNVDLTTKYRVTRDGKPVNKKLANAFANDLYVDFLYNTTGDKDYEVLFDISLKDLSNMTPDDLATRIETELKKIKKGGCILWWCWDPVYKEIDTEKSGIAVGETANFDVQFRFHDTGEPQNHLQNLQLELEWIFEGYQTDGEER